MTRLYLSRSAPSTRLSKPRKRSKKKRNLLGRHTHSTGNLQHGDKVRSDKKNLWESLDLIEQELSPSKHRWIALSLFCALSCTQCCIWSTWSPIANSLTFVFPTWNKSLIALLSNWGCIIYLTCCIPCCYFINKKGLFVPLQTAATLSTVAAFVRCLSTDETIFTILAHTCAMLNSLSGVIISPMTALLSAVWFPRGERTTATGISSACNQLGLALSYVVGPAIVSTSPPEAHSNFTQTTQPFTTQNTLTSTDENSISLQIRVEIMSLLRIEFLAQFLILLGTLCLFPRDPRHFLGVSSISPHLGLTESIMSLLQNGNMWRLCLAAALSQGVTGPWLAMITVTFDTTISQAEAETLAFWTVVCSSVMCLAASRLTDIFQGHLKVTIHVLLTTSVAMFLWMLLLDSRVLAFHKSELYLAVILGTSASWSTPALFLELGSEIAFPVSEAIVGGYMIFLSNLIGTLFYFAYFISGFAERWSTYCVFGNVFIASVLVISVREEYNRTNMESNIELELYQSVEKIQDRKKHLRKPRG